MNRELFSARVVLFDWDGTLLDSFSADVRAYTAMFRAMEVQWDAASFEDHYSPDWYRVYRAVGLPRGKWTEADRIWRAAYANEAPPLLPGARKLLRMLSCNFRLGIVTSGSRSRVRKQLRSFKLAKYFSACVCAGDTIHRKPHPAPIQLAMKRMCVSPEDAIYIGDSAEDVEMARRAGVRAIGVLGPFPTEKRIRAAKPDLLLPSIKDLAARLRPKEEKRPRRGHR